MAANIVELLAQIGALDQKPGTVQDAGGTAAYRAQHPNAAMPRFPGNTTATPPQNTTAVPFEWADPTKPAGAPDPGSSAVDDIWGFIKKGIDIIDTPRAFVVSGVKELSDALYSTGWSKALGLESDEEYRKNRERMGSGSWDEFVDQGWRNIGFREVWDKTHDSEGDKSWLNRIIGVAGDVALDPLTHAGAKMVPGRQAATKAEQVAQRELAAAARGGGRNEVAKQLTYAAKRAGLPIEGAVKHVIAEAAQRGTGALTKKAIQRAGLSADEIAALGIGELRTTIMKMAIPGSRVLSDAGAATRGAAKKAFGELPWAKAWRSAKLSNHGGEVYWVNQMRAKGVSAARRVEATKALATVNKMREVSRRWADSVAKMYRKDFGKELHRLGHEARVTTTHALESGATDPMSIKLRAFFDKVRQTLVKEGVEVGHVENYVPHVVTDEFRALAQKDKSLLKWITNPDTKQGFQKTRLLGPGKPFMDVPVLQTGSIAEINEISMRNLGVRLFEDDVVEIMPRYLLKGQKALEATAQRKALREVELIAEAPPPKGMRKLTSEERATRAAQKKAAAAARREESIALSDGMRVRRGGIAAAKEANIAARKANGERIIEIEQTVNDAGRDRVEAVTLVNDLEGQLSSAEVKLETWQAELEKIPPAVRESVAKTDVVIAVENGVPTVASTKPAAGVRANATVDQAQRKALERIQKEIDETERLIDTTKLQITKAKRKLARIEKAEAEAADPERVARIAAEKAAMLKQIGEIKDEMRKAFEAAEAKDVVAQRARKKLDAIGDPVERAKAADRISVAAAERAGKNREVARLRKQLEQLEEDAGLRLAKKAKVRKGPRDHPFIPQEEQMIQIAQQARLLRIRQETAVAWKNGDVRKLNELAAERRDALRVLDKGPSKSLLTRDEILRLNNELDALKLEQARLAQDALDLQEFGLRPSADKYLKPPTATGVGKSNEFGRNIGARADARGMPDTPVEALEAPVEAATAPKATKTPKKPRKAAEDVVEDMWESDADITFDDMWGGDDAAQVDDLAGWEPPADYFGDPRFAPPDATVAPLAAQAERAVSRETAAIADLKMLPQTADSAAKVATSTSSFIAADKETVLGFLNDTERDLDDVFSKILDVPEGKGLDAKRANAYELRAQIENARQLLEQSGDPSLDVIAKLEAQAAIFDMKALKAGKEAFEADDFVKAMSSPEFRAYMEREAEAGFRMLDETHQIPSWVDDALQVEHRMKEFGKVAKWWDKFNNLWKGWATMTPGFLNRNIYGGLMNIYLEGGARALGNAYRFAKFWNIYRKNPETYMNEAVRVFGRDTAERMDDAMGIIFGTGGGQVPAEVLVTPGGKRTLLDRANIGTGLKVNPFSTDFAPVRGTRAASTNIEAVLRGGHAFDVLSRGGTADLAQDVVTKWHFNYMDISDLDKNIKRYGIPFWTFFSRNLALQAHVWSHMPQKLNRTYFNVKRNVEYGNERDQTRPQWFDESGAIQLGDAGDTTGFLIPDLPSIRAVGDVGRLANPLDGRWMGDLNPLLKLPMEQAFGKQAFSGVPFRDSYGETVDGQRVGREAPLWAQIPGIQQVLEGLGQVKQNASGQTVMTDRSQYMLESLMPFLGQQNRVVPNQPKQEDRQLQNLLSFLGVGYRENNASTRQGELYRRKLAAEKAAKQRKELGL